MSIGGSAQVQDWMLCLQGANPGHGCEKASSADLRIVFTIIYRYWHYEFL